MRGALDVRYLRPLIDELYSLIGGAARTEINNLTVLVNNLIAGGFTSVATITALSAVNAKNFVPGHLAYVQTPKSYWNYDPTSLATPNGETIIAATGGGNWLNSHATGTQPAVSSLAFPNVFVQGKSITNGAMLLGASNVTGPVGTWTQANIGNLVVVPGALAGGQTLFGSITAVSANGSSATTNAVATAAVTNQTIAWGPDDAPGLQAAINVLVGTSIELVLGPGIYMLGSGLAIPAPGRLTIRGSAGTTMVGAMGTGLASAFSIISASQNNLDSTNSTTLAAQANAGSNTISTNTLGSHAPNFVIGGYIFIGIFTGPTHIFSSTYQIRNITGVGPFTITLDRPLQYTFPVATTTIWNMPGGRVEDVRIYGEGMKLTGSCQQFLEFGLAAHCLVQDVMMDMSIGNPAGTVGAFIWDAGSFDCEAHRCRVDGGVNGVSPGGAALTTLNQGLSIIQSEQSRFIDCVVENCTAGLAQISFSASSYYQGGTYGGAASFGITLANATACNIIGVMLNGGAGAVGTGIDIGASTGCRIISSTVQFCQTNLNYEANNGNTNDCSAIGCKFIGATLAANVAFLGGGGGTLTDCGLVDCASTGAALSHGIDINANSGPVTGTYMTRVDATANPGGSGVNLRTGATGTTIDTIDVTGNGAFGMNINADLLASKVISRGGNAGGEEVQVLGGRVTLRDVDIQVTAGNAFGIYTVGTPVVEVTGRVRVVAGGGNCFNLYFDTSSVGSVHDFQATSSIGGATTGITAAQVATRMRVGLAVDADGTTTPFVVTGQSNRGSIIAAGTGGVQSIPFSVVRSQERPQLTLKTVGGTPTAQPTIAVNAGVGWNVTFSNADTSTYDYIGI